MLRVCEAVDFMVQGSLQRILRSVVLRCDQCGSRMACLGSSAKKRRCSALLVGLVAVCTILVLRRH